jgi:CBS domain-containing protein
MLVSAILKTKGNAVVTVDPKTTIAQVIRKLADHRIGAVVVLERGTVKGIVSERDIVIALADAAKTSTQTLESPAEAIMTSPVISCQPTDTVDQIMSEMTARRFRHFPVVEQGNLIGIVSIGDLVKMRIAEAEMETAAMRDYITAR